MYNSFNWLTAGLPLLSFPSLGKNRWDGSRWVSSTDNKEDTNLTDLYTYRDSSDGFSTPGVDSGTDSPSAHASSTGKAGEHAASAMATAAGQAALGSAAKAGIGLAAGLSPSEAFGSMVSGLANPGTLGGIVGAGLNAGLGLSSLGPTQAALTGLATVLGGPIAGALVGAFGGLTTNALADAFDARDQEQLHDLAEDTYGHMFDGLIAGKNMEDHVNDAISKGADMDGVALAGAQAAADNGLAGTKSGALAAASAALNGSFSPEALGTGTVSPSTMAGVMGMGVLGGLAQTGLVGEDNMALAAQSAPASTTTQGGDDNDPSPDVGAPDSALGAIAGAMAANAAAGVALGDSVAAAVANADAAAAEANALGDSDAANEGNNGPGAEGGGGDAGAPGGPAGGGDPNAEGGDPNAEGGDI